MSHEMRFFILDIRPRNLLIILYLQTDANILNDGVNGELAGFSFDEFQDAGYNNYSLNSLHNSYETKEILNWLWPQTQGK
jgi:hypothetical protein